MRSRSAFRRAGASSIGSPPPLDCFAARECGSVGGKRQHERFGPDSRERRLRRDDAGRRSPRPRLGAVRFRADGSFRRAGLLRRAARALRPGRVPRLGRLPGGRPDHDPGRADRRNALVRAIPVFHIVATAVLFAMWLLARSRSLSNRGLRRLDATGTIAAGLALHRNGLDDAALLAARRVAAPHHERRAPAEGPRSFRASRAARPGSRPRPSWRSRSCAFVDLPRATVPRLRGRRSSSRRSSGPRSPSFSRR